MRKGILLLGISLSFSFALECKNYRVKEGDTLERIARREGIDINTLKSANRGIDERRLRVGQTICIPVKATQVRSTEKYAIYEVKRGDTLQRIANSFGVDVKTLKEFNNLKDDRIVEGQKIRIPARTSANRIEGSTIENHDIYTVRRGGRLEHVAQATGVPLRDLERLNPELRGKWLPAGTKVRVPKGSLQAKTEGRESPGEKYEIYTVKRGGRLEHVAQATGVPLRDLERLNPELRGKWLPAGTKVKVPVRERQLAEARRRQENYDIYKVRRGGRLSDVSRVTGVPLRELERLNPELKGKFLRAGTEVKIPKRETLTAEGPTQDRRQQVSRREERAVLAEPERETPTILAPRNLNIPIPVEGKVVKVPKGIEISAPCSSPVRAVEEGRVIYSGGDLQAYGNMVIVEHENFISLYAYNETNLVRRGERVSRGQVIAKVGKKNNSEECILRFELRNKEGVPLDPTEYIRDLQ
ncbi:LysM peptidoglycan-binding domain-containing protein [Hydrogenobacter sp. T-2]|uniref:LysM peptidoglycan-binding domain-containing protein n=1 Tax=Pampinifervens diazotrophicum TaxID=1632018 RepID=UPI002B25BB9F|nr:LysM peptidoglycan-binding domain-containing protein [Hydrogenobacter sp. T-2]WPM32021.1 LysM peptidoglycan-binding domain-containing protein [Hydrogenobacter sp. T-2]